jgi:hypothetical protein
MVGQFVPDITENNLMSAWQSVFGDVADRRIASSDKNPDSQNTKGIWVASTRKPNSIPTSEVAQLERIKCTGVDALIDRTTVRKEVGYPDLRQTTILELLGKRWKLDEPPIFYQAAPASMQNQACQNRRLSDNHTNRLLNRRTNCKRRRLPDGSKHHAGLGLSNRHSPHTIWVREDERDLC